MSGANLGDWLMLLFVVGIVFVLVRPKSKAAEAVDGLANLFIAMVKRAADLAA